MNIFKYRNLALGCAGFLFLLYISYYINMCSRIILLIVPLAFLLIGTVIHKIKNNDILLQKIIKYTPLCLFSALAMIISLYVFETDRGHLSLCDENEHDIVAVVNSIEYCSDYMELYKVTIKSADGDDKNIKAIFSVTLGDNRESKDGFANETLDIGDTLNTTAKFRRLHDSEFGYSEETTYLDDGILLCAECEKYKIISHSEYSAVKFFGGINSTLDKILGKSLNKDTSSLVSALLLGNKNGLSDNVKRDFSRLGISHILALSGMHLSLLVLLIGSCITFLRIPKAVKIPIIIFSVVIFDFITGFSDSVMRASLMLILFNVFSFFGKKCDSITGLFLSVTLICIFSPYSIFSVSLALSFLAMFACFLTSRLFLNSKSIYKIKFKPLKYIITTFIITICVNIFTLPILFLNFGFVSLISPIANIVIVPLFTVLLYAAPFVLLFSGVPIVSETVASVCEFLVKIILYITSEAASLPGIVMSITGSVQKIGIIIIVTAIIISVVASKKKLKYSFVLVITGITVFVMGSIGVYTERAGVVSFTAYSENSNDIIAAETKNKLIIADISSGSWNSVSDSYSLSSYLGYSEIEYYIVCDYGNKLSRSLERLSDKIYIRNILLPKPQNEDEEKIYAEIESMSLTKNISASEITEEKMNFYGVDFIFHIDQKLPRSVKRVVAFSATCLNSKFIYLGASSYELTDYFSTDAAALSDVVVFGSYGPEYQIEYSYNIYFADYLLFLGNSRKYASCRFIEKIGDSVIIANDFPVRFEFR